MCANAIAVIPRILPYNLRNRSSHAALVKQCQEVLASKFCELMTSDMSFKSHNEYWVGFYKEVTLEVNIRILHHFFSG
jgi:hypothetical protein